MHALNRLNLNHYFDIIIGSDTSSNLLTTHSKMDDVIKLKNKNQIFNQNEVLFIDNDIKQINNISNECIAYFIDNSISSSLFGPIPDDFNHIECILHDRKYHRPKISKYDPKTSLNSINSDLCTSFFREIIINHKQIYEPLETLSCMKYAKKRAIDNADYHKFIEFGHKFAIVLQTDDDKEQQWIYGYLLQELLKFEQDHVDLWNRYAKSLSHLKHNKAAEDAYSKALTLSPTN